MSKTRVKLPEFPKSSSMIFQFQTEKKLNIRKGELQNYLQETLAIPELETNPDLKQFLELPEK